MAHPRNSTILATEILLYISGVVASLYLLSISWTGQAAACALFGSECAQVVGSEYGSILGMPVASFGLAYFTAQLSLRALAGLAYGPKGGGCLRLLSIGLNFLAVGASLFFLFLLFMVLRQSCIACFIVHLINFATLGCSVILFKNGGKYVTVREPARVQLIGLSGLLLALCLFLAVNMMYTRDQLYKERSKLANNLDYYLFIHGQAQKHEFMRQEPDTILGEPGIAIHQMVLIIKQGCPHCQRAKEVLSQAVTEHEMAVYLLIKDFSAMSRERLQELEVETVPALFINGRRALGWELPGFLDTYTSDCGC